MTASRNENEQGYLELIDSLPGYVIFLMPAEREILLTKLTSVFDRIGAKLKEDTQKTFRRLNYFPVDTLCKQRFFESFSDSGEKIKTIINKYKNLDPETLAVIIDIVAEIDAMKKIYVSFQECRAKIKGPVEAALNSFKETEDAYNARVPRQTLFDPVPKLHLITGIMRSSGTKTPKK